MDFEFDQAKSETNFDKHRIDFEAAKALRLDPLMLIVPARTRDERRFVAIGRIDGRHWAAIWTPRDAKIRLISVRRARSEEIDRYESR